MTIENTKFDVAADAAALVNRLEFVREGQGRWQVARCHPGYRTGLARGDTLKMALAASNITISSVNKLGARHDSP